MKTRKEKGEKRVEKLNVKMTKSCRNQYTDHFDKVEFKPTKWIISWLNRHKFMMNSPHGPSFVTLTHIFPRQACCFILHSLWSCTPSDAQIGLRMLVQVGQMHCGLLFKTLQPSLYGALQPGVTQGSREGKYNKVELAIIICNPVRHSTLYQSYLPGLIVILDKIPR